MCNPATSIFHNGFAWQPSTSTRAHRRQRHLQHEPKQPGLRCDAQRAHGALPLIAAQGLADRRRRCGSQAPSRVAAAHATQRPGQHHCVLERQAAALPYTRNIYSHHVVLSHSHNALQPLCKMPSLMHLFAVMCTIEIELMLVPPRMHGKRPRYLEHLSQTV